LEHWASPFAAGEGRGHPCSFASSGAPPKIARSRASIAPSSIHPDEPPPGRKLAGLPARVREHEPSCSNLNDANFFGPRGQVDSQKK